MNNFYKQPKSLVWIQSTLFLLLGMLLGIVIIAEGNDQPLFYLLFILYVPISQFLFTPIYTLTGDALMVQKSKPESLYQKLT